VQSLFGKTPKPDDSLARQRMEAESKAAREREELDAKKREDDSARQRGLRGARSLFSDTGGFLGFGGKTTLGG
jgi:hypothetical protein